MKNVLLVGNPNCGKSTFFNNYARAQEHIGNWHGVTAICKEKHVEKNGQVWNVIDTPGIYSLSPFSFEEEETLKCLDDHKNDKIINICDRDNIQKNLYLTLCLLEENFDVSLLLNSTKKKAKYSINQKTLSQELGIKVCQVDASKTEEVKSIGDDFFEKTKHKKLRYCDANFAEKSDVEKAKTRYDYIDRVLDVSSKKLSESSSKIDKVVLNKFFSIPIFLTLMLFVFYITFFALGDGVSNFLNLIFEKISHPVLGFIENIVGKYWIYDMFDKAIFGGISTILSFLPQIVLLMFFLNAFEESGYLSRVAFVFDDLLSKIGLSGKSVYTILMSFGCSTSAIMTSKIVDDKNAKIKAALICPFMSCSAKLPIYFVFGMAFFGNKNLFAIFAFYLLGLVVSFALCSFLNKHFLKSIQQTFVLEFPEYRMVSFKKTLHFLYQNTNDFLEKVGSILLCVNIIFFVLNSFSFSFEYVGILSDKSILNQIAKILAPIFIPLGFGKSQFVSVLFGGFAAKELIVSVIALFNGVDGGAIENVAASLSNKQNAICFNSLASVVSFLSFCVLYVPCLSSILMLKSEVGKKWCFIVVILQFVSAYVVSLLLYNLFFAIEIFGIWEVIVVLLAIGLVLFSVCIVYKKLFKKGCFSCKGNCRKNCDKNKS